ncbi:hypothetical protein [Haloarcula pellucida]|uniref:Uncharacterized protein n=1 Tax=Haloarcula pellucida TaxID=1427151 RepID=A0A830GKU4_9EURY|nr:hypothetical protein [Halomicroarcula pellucida]MBX0348679.1 hypothetical protein [Halomicroarcula pellucida]GGN92258.1 hypothetical protein GCM10009030_16300 [Halomicroarcula pellucida]
MSGRFLSVDCVRVSDLSPVGWFGIGIGLAGVAYAAREITAAMVFGGSWLESIVVGSLALVIGLGIAYADGGPEVEAACDHCGQYIRSQSSRDGVEEFVEVKASGSPRRAHLGPLSLVLQRQTEEWTYCSGDCAAADADRRALIDDADHSLGMTPEVADD